MTPEAKEALASLRRNLRPASLAQIGGFRPPDNPLTSWFGKGVALESEPLPEYNGKPMFPLLQINTSELPFIPQELSNTALLVLYLNRDEFPFDKSHGDGWLIREYASLGDLEPLPSDDLPLVVKPFPIHWTLVEDDAPSWEDSGSVISGMEYINDDEEASEAFYTEFKRYHQTKVGGYPDCIQHEALRANTEFVFQVGSEEKAQWMWAENGIGYFYKDATGKWSWDCQFY